jgi:hypothetical protein
MQADFSVELGGDAPALEIPWSSDDPHVCYYDLKKYPELMQKIPEAAAYPELGSFLSRINAIGFPLATAKCDAWASNEVAPEEEIFGDRKFVSYIDLVFVDQGDRCSFEKHEAFAKELCGLLGQAPQIAATVELVIRHCYYHQQNIVSENEAERDGALSKTVKDSGMSLSRNDDTMDHSGQADVTRCGEYTDIAPQGESATVTNHGMHVRVIQDEPANVFDAGRHVRALPREELSKVTAHDEQGRVPSHGEFAALTEGKQSNAQEFQRADLLHCDDSFKTEPLGKTEPSGKSRTAPSGESRNVELERKRHCKEPNSSVTGFCLTAYVTGFGDSDHDPLRRWAIGLNLLQHAIVQLNSKLQPNH